MESKDKRTGWIRDLEVGSRVFISNYNTMYLREVSGITPTGRMTIGCMKFSEYGKEMNSKHGWSLVQCTEERLKGYLCQQSIRTLLTRICEVVERRNHIEWEEKDLIDVWNTLKKYHKKEE